MKKQKDYIENCWNEVEKKQDLQRKTSKKKMKKKLHVVNQDEPMLNELERFLLGVCLMFIVFIYICLTT